MTSSACVELLPSGQRFVFLLNHPDAPVIVAMPADAVEDLLARPAGAHELLPAEITLAPAGVVVVRCTP
jgi:hypothetical protein